MLTGPVLKGSQLLLSESTVQTLQGLISADFTSQPHLYSFSCFHHFLWTLCSSSVFHLPPSPPMSITSYFPGRFWSSWEENVRRQCGSIWVWVYIFRSISVSRSPPACLLVYLMRRCIRLESSQWETQEPVTLPDMCGSSSTPGGEGARRVKGTELRKCDYFDWS